MARLLDSQDRRRRAAYQETPNDVEAARRLGLVPDSFRGWRTSRGLPSKTSPTVSADEGHRRRRAYDQTSTDGDAARLLGLQRRSYAAWRKRVGLPAKTLPGKPLQAGEEERRRRAYEAAQSDAQAAQRLGMTRRDFCQWRNHRGLAPKSPRQMRRLSSDQERRRYALYQQGLTDEEVGARLGLSLEAIHGWRRRHGLPAHHARVVEPEERRRRLAAYQASSTDRAAARRLGMTLGMFRQWREGEDLPTRGPLTRPVSPAEHVRRRAAYERTSNDVEAARLLQISKGAFQGWRVRAGLVCKAARGPLLSPEEEARRHRIYWASPTDSAAARSIRVRFDTYTYWRRTRELPPRRPSHHIPPTVVERRKRVIESSRTPREAADQLGVTPPTITAWARRYGIPGRGKPRRFHRARSGRVGPAREVRGAGS